MTYDCCIMDNSTWNNSWNESSEGHIRNSYFHELESPTFVQIFDHYIVPGICVMGLVGNILLLSVFLVLSLHLQPCSFFWTALVSADTMFLMTKLLMSYMRTKWSCQVIIYISYVCSFLSAWFVVFMIAEKSVIVCFPLRASRLCTRRNSIAILLLTVMFSSVLYLHCFVTVSIANGECIINAQCYYILKALTYADTCIVFVIPFIAVVATNVKIIAVLKRSKLHNSIYNRSYAIGSGGSEYQCRLRRHDSGDIVSKAQVKSTKVLVLVSTIFLLLHLPSYAVRLYGMVLYASSNDVIDGSANKIYVIQSVVQFLYYLKFGVGSVVYFIATLRFRRRVPQYKRTTLIR